MLSGQQNTTRRSRKGAIRKMAGHRTLVGCAAVCIAALTMEAPAPQSLLTAAGASTQSAVIASALAEAT